MPLAMTPLVSLLFATRSLTEHDEMRPGAARFGEPVWGARALLADLELRLGLATSRVADAVRVQRWAHRLDEALAKAPRFYARSFDSDRLGTATALLAMRDELLDAGWNGESIPGGGERLDTFCALEKDSDLPPGDGDRLRAVEAHLGSAVIRPYDEIRLAEPRAVWPGRWQRVFGLLEGLGVPVRHIAPAFESTRGDGDRARVQAALRGDTEKRAPALCGDGSLVVLRAETSWELSHAVAALLRAWGDASTVVVRGGDESALDGALVAARLASQGLDGVSAWRPVLQILPLAIELAYEPRDPYRVLELLTLPVGPFAGMTGRELAAALSEAPGIGGRPWLRAKKRIADLIREWEARRAKENGKSDAEAQAAGGAEAAERLHAIEEWLEFAGRSAHVGAPREDLSAVAARVRAWLAKQLGIARREAEREPGDRVRARRLDVICAAVARAEAFSDALANDPRDKLDLVDARLLLEQVSSAHALELEVEQAGRVDSVGSPAALRVARDVVVWWHCVAGTEWRPAARPWRRVETRALAAAGAALSDPAQRLAAEAAAWRQAVLAARRRLVLAVPRWACGEALDAHPLWHEIVARLGAKDVDVARVSVDARDLLDGRPGPLASAKPAAVVDLGALQLPEARAEWNVDARAVDPPAHYSASSLEVLVGCPLRWVLERGAGLRAGALASLPEGPLLYGKLGHRLVEELHRAGAFARSGDLASHFHDLFDRLLREEAAGLRRAGMTFELAQLRTQIETAIGRLSELLVASQLRVADVECKIEVEWRGRRLKGRIDVLLADTRAGDVVLDLKWGHSSYVDLLKSGRAIQLAVYVTSRRIEMRAKQTPAGAYFSIKRGRLLATDVASFAGPRPIEGPHLTDTWTKLERTVDVVESALAAGRIPVTGVSRALPLLDALGVADRDAHLELDREAACKYCSFGAICGKDWEKLA